MAPFLWAGGCRNSLGGTPRQAVMQQRFTISDRSRLECMSLRHSSRRRPPRDMPLPDQNERARGRATVRALARLPGAGGRRRTTRRQQPNSEASRCGRRQQQPRQSPQKRCRPRQRRHTNIAASAPRPPRPTYSQVIWAHVLCLNLDCVALVPAERSRAIRCSTCCFHELGGTHDAARVSASTTPPLYRQVVWRTANCSAVI